MQVSEESAKGARAYGASTNQMPFIQQVITPVNLSRPSSTNERYRNVAAASSADGSGGNGTTDTDNEFDRFVNHTLSNVLRQLASVLAVADGIFTDLNNELGTIRTRADTVRRKIGNVDKSLEEYDLEMLRKFMIICLISYIVRVRNSFIRGGIKRLNM